jgi:hypothetical protein
MYKITLTYEKEPINRSFASNIKGSSLTYLIVLDINPSLYHDRVTFLTYNCL